MTEFGNWIRLQRTSRGMTQTECADRAGMKVQQWSRMEKLVNRPEYDTLAAVSRALRVPLEEVMIAADYTIAHPEKMESRIGRRLEPLLMQAPPERRPAIESALEQVARAMVSG